MSRWKEMQSVPEEPEIPVEQEAPPGMEAVEKEFADQMDEALAAFQERRKKEDKRFADVTDSGYYFVVCFTSRAQMDEFCDRFGMDKNLWVHDGRELAKTLKRALRTPDPDVPREKSKRTDYADRAMKPYTE